MFFEYTNNMYMYVYTRHTLKIGKDIRMACQKLQKQVRDDIQNINT